jgi:hypothetical protein
MVLDVLHRPLQQLNIAAHNSPLSSVMFIRLLREALNGTSQRGHQLPVVNVGKGCH